MLDKVVFFVTLLISTSVLTHSHIAQKSDLQGCWSNNIDGIVDEFCINGDTASTLFVDPRGGVVCVADASVEYYDEVIFIYQPQTENGCNDESYFIEQAFICSLETFNGSTMGCFNNFVLPNGEMTSMPLLFTKQ